MRRGVPPFREIAPSAVPHAAKVASGDAPPTPPQLLTTTIEGLMPSTTYRAIVRLTPSARPRMKRNCTVAELRLLPEAPDKPGGNTPSRDSRGERGSVTADDGGGGAAEGSGAVAAVEGESRAVEFTTFADVPEVCDRWFDFFFFIAR